MKRPFFTVGMSFLAAMAVSFSFGSWSTAGMLLLLLPLGFLLSKGTRRQLGLVVLSIVTACLVFQGYLLVRYEPVSRLDGQTLTFSGTVLEREKSGGARRYEMKGRFLGVEGIGETSIQLTSYEDLGILPGEEVQIPVQVKALAWEEGWQRNLIAKGIFLTATPKGAITCLEESSHPLESRLSRWRDQLREEISQTVGGSEGAVAVGMTLGGSDLLSREEEEAFRKAGLSHLLAISGYHLVVLTSGVDRILRKMRFPKILRISLLLSLIWGYALLLGLPMSIRRAATVLTLSLLAQAVGRKADGLTSTGVAAFLMTLVNPFCAGSLSVQMTFLSSLGIQLWAAPIADWMEGHLLYPLGEKRKRLRWALEAFALCLSAQLALTPLLAGVFGGLPLYGPLAAVLTCLLIPGVIGGTLLLMVCPLLSPVLVPIIRFCSRGIIQVAFGVSSLPGAYWFTREGVLPYLLTFGVGCLLLLTLWEAKGKTIQIAALGFALLLFGWITVEQIYFMGKVEQFTLDGWNGWILTRQGRAVVAGSPGSLSRGQRISDLLDRQGVEEIDLLILPRETNGAGLDLLAEEHPIAYIVAGGSAEYREGLEELAKVIPYTPMEIEALGNVKISLAPGGEMELILPKETILP